MSSIRQHSKSKHLAFLIALGMMGWAALAGAALRTDGVWISTDPAPLAVFMGIIVVARVFAFRVVDATVLALDSALYAAAAVCLGAVSAGLLVGIALTLDALVRPASARPTKRTRHTGAIHTGSAAADATHCPGRCDDPASGDAGSVPAFGPAPAQAFVSASASTSASTSAYGPGAAASPQRSIGACPVAKPYGMGIEISADDLDISSSDRADPGGGPTTSGQWRAQRLSSVPAALAERSVVGILGYALYLGGMSGALLMGCGWLVGATTPLLGGASQHRLVAAMLGAGLIFLVLHYAIQGGRRYLGGESLSIYVRRIAAQSLLAEMSLLPLGAVVVLIYDPRRLLGLILLGATYVVINVVYSRLSRASAELGRRVHELETLSATARRFNSTLELRELVDTIVRETAAALPGAEAITLIHTAGDSAQRMYVDWLDREHGTIERLSMDRHELGQGERASAFARVMDQSRSLCISDLRDVELDLGSLGAVGERSWMGVPIVMYGSVEGVLAVHSRRPGAFCGLHVPLCESIAMQAASALKNAHLYALAMVDGLTGLFMRRYFDARLHEELQVARRHGTAFSVVMMDIDNFKELNDTYGHPVGDRVLRGIGSLVRNQMRGGDTAARYGGEEIAMILPRTDMLQAWNQAERIRSMIAEMCITVDERIISVTASFGIAAYPDSRASDGEELVRRADSALYVAKHNGKNRVELYWSESSAGDSEGPQAMRGAISEPSSAAIGAG